MDKKQPKKTRKAEVGTSEKKSKKAKADTKNAKKAEIDTKDKKDKKPAKKDNAEPTKEEMLIAIKKYYRRNPSEYRDNHAQGLSRLDTMMWVGRDDEGNVTLHVFTEDRIFTKEYYCDYFQCYYVDFGLIFGALKRLGTDKSEVGFTLAMYDFERRSDESIKYEYEFVIGPHDHYHDE
jgi:hypothetical protein